MAKFKAVREVQGDEVILHLEGVLDGAIDFRELVGPIPKRLTIDCSRVHHANSSLVKVWMQFFGPLTAQGTELRLAGCSTPIIEYVNFVGGFLCGGKVQSVQAPFFCKHCKRSFSLLIDTLEPLKVETLITTQRCTSCFGPAVFDDDLKEFFNFMGGLPCKPAL